VGVPLIAAGNVSKSFGPTEALRRVSVAVAAKDVACVIGPSGAGKTTLLRCPAPLERPTGGNSGDEWQRVTFVSR
jgi:ABC-type Fe3+/spermidine/putrescine transport system ATPase subunit